MQKWVQELYVCKRQQLNSLRISLDILMVLRRQHTTYLNTTRKHVPSEIKKLES